jgi:hypothetical protein
MKWKVTSPGTFFRTVRESFFLRRHYPDQSTMHVLKTIYPGVNWDRVDFYEGLPWFTPVVAPYVNAQALPQFYSLNRFRIYLRKFDESRAQCVADIVHEAFHVMQAMHFRRGYGIGFFRGWMLFYIAHFLREGYRNNVFEIPAYDQEFRFLQACLKHGLHGVVPKVDPEKLKNVVSEKDLLYPSYKYRYSGSFLYLPLSFLICLAVTVIKPFADLVLFVVSFPARKNKDQPAAVISSS